MLSHDGLLHDRVVFLIEVELRRKCVDEVPLKVFDSTVDFVLRKTYFWN